MSTLFTGRDTTFLTSAVRAFSTAFFSAANRQAPYFPAALSFAASHFCA